MVEKLTKSGVQPNNGKKPVAKKTTSKAAAKKPAVKTEAPKSKSPVPTVQLPQLGEPTIGSLLGQKKPNFSPEVKAVMADLNKKVEAENKKKASMTPQQRAKYEAEQDKLLLDNIRENRETAERKKTAWGRYKQGWIDTYKDAKTIGDVAKASVDRTRRGFAAIDDVVGLPQGTSEKVWLGAAIVATGGAVMEAGATVATTTASTLGTATKVGTVAFGATALASCSTDDIEEIHNLYVDIPTDTITKYEQIYLPADTVKIPVIQNDTVWKEKLDTIYQQVHDTTFIERVDTVRFPEIVEVHDTIKVPVPGPVVEVPEKWTSEVPPKQKEILEKVGVDVDKNGEFVLSMNYYDEYNQALTMKKLNGKKSTRDGQKLVFDEIRTGWGDDGIKLGQNETYARYEYSLSSDKKNLNVRQLLPAKNTRLSNSINKPNWEIFGGILNDETQWVDNGIVTLKVNDDGNITMTGNGEYGKYTLSKGDVENSVMVTNPYNAQWRLSDFKVKTGNAQ